MCKIRVIVRDEELCPFLEIRVFNIYEGTERLLELFPLQDYYLVPSYLDGMRVGNKFVTSLFGYMKARFRDWNIFDDSVIKVCDSCYKYRCKRHEDYPSEKFKMKFLEGFTFLKSQNIWVRETNFVELFN